MFTILFDIDGTLINTGGAGMRAVARALASEFSIDKPADVAVMGRTDRSIVGDLFVEHGIDDSDENWSRFSTAYLSELPEALRGCQGQILPGVRALLQAFSARPDVALGLLTGNTRQAAQLKLQYYELAHHFRFGGFGDQHRHRDDVARQALDAARSHLNGIVYTEFLWVIGDTVHDVTCARAIGARVVAVKTGGFCDRKLAKSKPDALVDSLSDVDGLMKLVGLA